MLESSCVTPTKYDMGSGSPVKFTAGKYKGNSGIVEKVTECMVTVAMKSPDIEKVVVRVPKTSVTLLPKSSASLPNEILELESSFQALNIQSPKYEISHQQEQPESFMSPSVMSPSHFKMIAVDQNSTFFLKEYFKERCLLFEDCPKISLLFNGDSYHLVVSRTLQRNHSFGMYGTKKFNMNVAYVAAKGSLDDLQEEIEKIADFASLPNPRKVAARLELLYSRARELKVLSTDDFEIIEETQASEDSGGCGFIPEDLLAKIVGGRIKGKRATSLQVRVFAPHLGIFKGILTRKLNIEKIQLTPSMKKVNRSRTAGPEENWVFLFIKNVFPSSSNRIMGKWIKGDEPCKSFSQKPLSHMIKRMLQIVGVPTEVITNFIRSGREDDRGGKRQLRKLRKEAWLLGVTDPTDRIPAGHVFLSGFHADSIPVVKVQLHGQEERSCQAVFITRSPCVLHSDGRLVPVLTYKPADMTTAHWDALRLRSMGEVIFSNYSLDGEHVGLPEVIGDGDLDGDLYYTCWDHDIVNSIDQTTFRCGFSDQLPASVAARDIIDTEEEKADESSTVEESFNDYVSDDESVNGSDCEFFDADEGGDIEDRTDSESVFEEVKPDAVDGWLLKAQKHMANPSVIKEKSIIGKLYVEMNKIADANDPDAVALAKAYKQAIDGQKHGGGLTLSDELRKRVGI